jgi:hypothetical protein
MNQPPRSEGILWWDIDIMLYNEPLKFYLYISNYYRVGIVANIYYYIGAWIYELCDYIIYPFKGDYWLIWIGRIKFLVFILFLTLYHKKPNYFSNYKVSYNVKTKIDLISIRYYYNIYTIKWINYFKLIKKNNNKIWF